MSDLVELKPCPFCGGRFVAQGASREFISVWCGCGAQGPSVPFPETCIDPVTPIRKCYELWNRRAPDPELSRLSALVAWQEIETAPKTGVFLVYAPDRKDGRKPYVGGSNFAVMVRHENVTLVGGNFAFDVPSPTHWRPLPAPPVSQLKDTTNADK